MGYLNQVSCTVPSVKGDIVLALDRGEDGAIRMTLTSPANTVARVGIPCDASATIICNGETVYANGVATGDVEGVELRSADGEYVYFTVQPGTWVFEASSAD